MKTLFTRFLLLFIVFIFCSITARAQYSCSGATGILFKEDFGDAGKTAQTTPGASYTLSQGATTGYTYARYNNNTSNQHPTEGEYSIVNITNPAPFNAWQTSLNDHTTSSSTGYMMLINSKSTTPAVYAKTNVSVCPNSRIYFSAWAANLCLKSYAYPKPNILLEVKNSSTGILLSSSQTVLRDTTAAGANAAWTECGVWVDIPAGVTSIDLAITDIQTQTNGNDFALDDITVRMCKPGANITSPNSAMVCEGAPITLNGTITDGDPSSVPGTLYSYQWYRSTDSITWTPASAMANNALIGDVKTLNATAISLPNLSKTNNYFRLAIAISGNLQDGIMPNMSAPCEGAYASYKIISNKSEFTMGNVSVCTGTISVNLKTLTLVAGDTAGLVLTYYKPDWTQITANPPLATTAETYHVVGTGLCGKDTSDVTIYQGYPIPASTLYVKTSPSGDGTGRDWDNAFDGKFLARYLKGSILPAPIDGTRIYVAEGTYIPYEDCSGTVNRTSFFEIQKNITITGGYSNNATGTDLSSYNPQNHITRLSGDIGTKGTVTDNTYHVVNVSSPNGATIDGLYISDGYADGAAASNYDKGAGIYTANIAGTLTINNATIHNNIVKGATTVNTTGGGGIYATCVLTVNNTTIKGNASTNSGGGIYTSKKLTLNTVTISNNKAGYNAATGKWLGSSIATAACYRGGGVNVTGDTLVLRGDIVFKNDSVSSAGNGSGNSHGGGGGIYTDKRLVADASDGLTSLLIDSCATLTPTDGTTVNLYNSVGGGIYINTPNNGSLLLRGAPTVPITISNNSSTNLGGGIFSRAVGTLSSNTGGTQLDYVTITGNSNASVSNANAGGGLFVDTGTGNFLILDHATVTNNNANSYGGGIGINGGTATITNSTISNNSAPTYGGGIYATGLLNISDVIVNKNTAGTRGGGIYAAKATNINEATISYNSSGSSGLNSAGGGIFLAADSLVLTGNVVFVKDSALQAGAIGSNLGGGAISIGGTSAKLIAMQSRGLTSLLIDSCYTNNGGDGGAIGANFTQAPNTAEITVKGNNNCPIIMSNNYADRNGGAISGRCKVIVLEGISFIKNRTNIYGVGGGAVFFSNTGISTAAFGPRSASYCLFQDNSAENVNGGAICIGSNNTDTTRLFNNTFYNNDANFTLSSGGAVHTYSPTSINFCTFYKNTSGGSPLSVVTGVNNIITGFNNNIVLDSIAGIFTIGNDNVIYKNATTAQVDSVLSQTIPTNNGGPTATLMIKKRGPAYNNALSPVVNPPLFDQRGTGYNRLFSCAYDAGAVELQEPDTLDITATADNYFLCASGETTFTLRGNVTNLKSTNYYRWQRLNPINQTFEDIASSKLDPDPVGATVNKIPVTTYYPDAADYDNSGDISLRLRVNTGVCGYVMDTIVVGKDISTPAAAMTIITQPSTPQDVCVNTEYVMKVVEKGGGLKDIAVALSDWKRTEINVTSAEYLYPVSTGTWRPMTVDNVNAAAEYFPYKIPQADDITLIGGDSLLVRFNVRPGCGFYAGSDMLFLLDGSGFCGLKSITQVKDTTNIFHINFGSDAAYSLTSKINGADNTTITNSSSDIITWATTFRLTSGAADIVKDSIYFLIPQGMQLVPGSLISTDARPAFYDESQATIYDFGDKGLEYRIPIPDNMVIGETRSFELQFKVTQAADCGDYPLYMEIIRRASLPCTTPINDETDPCAIYETEASSYPDLKVEWYQFQLSTDQTGRRGRMQGGYWTGSYNVQAITPMQQNVVLPMQFIVDQNNDTYKDAGDTQQGSTFNYTIPKNLAAGDTLNVFLNTPVKVEDDKELLLFIPKGAICDSIVLPIVPVFGPETLCEGDTMYYHTTPQTSNIINYTFNIIDGVSGATPRRISAEREDINWQADLDKSKVRLIAGKESFTIYSQYRLADGKLLNPTDMRITVASAPVVNNFNYSNPVCTETSEVKLNFGLSGVTTAYSYSLDAGSPVSIPASAIVAPDSVSLSFLSLSPGSHSLNILNPNGCQSKTIPLTVSPFIPNRDTWTAQGRPNDWNDPENWDKKGVPGHCTYVIIPGSLPFYPILEATTDAVCDTIEFHMGGEVVRTDLLTYNASLVQLSINTNQFYGLSAPLRNMYTGDYMFSRANPLTEMRRYLATTPEVGVVLADWSKPFNTTIALLNPGMGYCTRVANTYYTTFKANPNDGAVASSKSTINSVTTWFPKTDVSYQYYNEASKALIPGKVDHVPSRDFSSRFIYEVTLGETSTVPVGNDLLTLPAAQGNIIVGNPFMSHLDFNEFYHVNHDVITPGYKILTGGNSYASFSGTDNDNDGTIDSYTSTGSLTPTSIPPMQSFIVETKSGYAGDGVLKITKPMSVSDVSSQLRAANAPQLLRISVDRNNVGTEAVVLISDKASNGYSSMEDSRRMLISGGVAMPPNIFTITDNMHLDVNRLKNLPEMLPIGISTDNKGTTTITISGLNSLSDHENIFFKDTQKPDLISVGSEDDFQYEFDNSVGNVIGRFFLVKKGSATGMDKNALDKLVIFSNRNNVVVTASDGAEIKEVAIFSLDGKIIYQNRQIQSNHIEIPVNALNQTLVVKARTENDSIVKIINTAE